MFLLPDIRFLLSEVLHFSLLLVPLPPYFCSLHDAIFWHQLCHLTDTSRDIIPTVREVVELRLQGRDEIAGFGFGR